MSNKQDRFKFINNDSNDISDEVEILTSGEEKENITDNKGKKKNKLYISFEARIITVVIAVLLLFSIACFLIYEVVNYTTDYKVNYTEITNTNYEVCLKDNTCANENEIYRSDEINIIKAAFAYNRNYVKEIKYNVGYHVVVVTRVYSDDRTQVYYENEKVLVDKTYTSATDKRLDINEKVTLDFSKYKKEIESYLPNNAECEVILYIDDVNETRQMSSVIIPLNWDEFGINIKETLNLDRSVDVMANVWDNYSIMFAVIASILILICIIIIYKTTRFLLKITINKNIFQQEVERLLREYDNIIVIARDGYESNIEREVIKVNTFDELLEIKNNTNKPIIYSRINDIKAEFLIEDKKLYKLTMKESDYE